ncbi:MAG: endopeptidase La [Lachnospiraceae bacterium]|nr:endopeptidase La [Lachnospiraceae bacterium]
MEDTIDIISEEKTPEADLLQVPAVALRGLTILPGMIIHFDLNRKKSICAVEQAMNGSQLLFVVTQKDEGIEEPGMQDLYAVGTVARLKQMSKLPNGIVRVLVEGIVRGRLYEIKEEVTNYLSVSVERVPREAEFIEDARKEAMVRQLKEMFQNYSVVNPRSGKMLTKKLENMTNPVMVIDVLTSGLPLAVKVKQTILETETVEERYDYLVSVLYNEIQVGQIRKELTEKMQKKVNKHQREYLLREQMHAIREELGEDTVFSDADRYTEALDKLKADKDVKEKIAKEISRFKSLSGSSSESAVERGYIETLLEMPWDKVSKDNMDIDRAECILEEDHYGLEEVKERVLEFLAVRSLAKKGAKRLDTPIMCLVGPPGTGKTSIARSVARALNKEYVRISLGGVRDEAEIRGHRKTYVGAMPGRIANGLKQAGVANPLMLLDEIDKVSSDYKGDPSAALLEVLDSEQNNRFRDHYIELPLDLSQVLFIATANSVSTIPRPLLDRMEVIEVNSYTDNEKMHIAKDHLMKKVYEKNAIKEDELTISDSALQAMIDGYTREAGVRNLEREIGKICRKAAKEILKKQAAAKKTSGKKSAAKATSDKAKKAAPIKVTAKNLEKYLGKVKYMPDKANTEPQVGIVRGLAWTSVGGDTLQIEVNIMPGKGDLELTGQMGDVMKESALTGLSYVRSVSEKFGIPAKTYQENDFHIHIPEGAVPKDGPSAGITMATALLSALTNRPVRPDIAMTGEITLRGRVLPIGGLKEKILAAKKAGIHKVLVPMENKKDIAELSVEITDGMEICFVERMEEVTEHALLGAEAQKKQTSVAKGRRTAKKGENP